MKSEGGGLIRNGALASTFFLVSDVYSVAIYSRLTSIYYVPQASIQFFVKDWLCHQEIH